MNKANVISQLVKKKNKSYWDVAPYFGHGRIRLKEEEIETRCSCGRTISVKKDDIKETYICECGRKHYYGDSLSFR